jgi:hypothetical protein
MDRRIMGTDVSDNYIMAEILTHPETFFTQNKPMKNHLMLGKRFMGHSVCIGP